MAEMISLEEFLRGVTVRLKGRPISAEALRSMAAQLNVTADQVDAGEVEIRSHSGMYISRADEDDMFVSVSLTFGPKRTLQ